MKLNIIREAIFDLCPGADFVFQNNKIVWHDKREQPTKDEIESKIKELEKKTKYDDALQIINKTFQSEIKDINSKYLDSERETWELQKTQANEYISNYDKKPLVKALSSANNLIKKKKTKTAFIEALAEANGISTLEFAKLILLKVESYEDQVSKALAKKQKAIKELENSQGGIRCQLKIKQQ